MSEKRKKTLFDFFQKKQKCSDDTNTNTHSIAENSKGK